MKNSSFFVLLSTLPVKTLWQYFDHYKL